LHEPPAKDVTSLDTMKQKYYHEKEIAYPRNHKTVVDVVVEHTLDIYAQQRRVPVTGVIDKVITAHSVCPYSVCPQHNNNHINCTPNGYRDHAQDHIWEVKVRIGDRVVLFKVDTGAEVTVLSEEALTLKLN